LLSEYIVMERQSSRFDWAHSSIFRSFHVLFWWWLNPILSLGYQRELTDEDLDDLSINDKCSVLLNKLSYYSENNIWLTNTTTWNIILRAFWKQCVFVIFLLIPYNAARVAQPLLLRQIVLYIISQKSQPDPPVTSFDAYIGYLYALGLFACSATQAFLHQQAYFRTTRIGMRVRNALSATIYKRLLSLNTASLQQTTTAAQTINLVANDASKFEEFCQYMNYLWEAPLQALIAFGLIWWSIGILPTLFGYGVLVLLIPLQLVFGRQFSQYRKTTMACVDKRVQAVNELVNGCQIVKMYNWEKPMEERVKKLRENELASILRASRLRAINMGLYFSSLPLISLATFGGYWLMGYDLKPVDIFTALTFFGLIRVPVTNYLPVAIERYAEMLAASKRIDAFMRLTKIQEKIIPATQIGTTVISMNNASFSWTETICLSNLTINIESGTLIGIVGPVGAGKSSLLSAILGEMTLMNGDSRVFGSFAYAAQSTWIFADTIRANILLGKPFDEQRYANIIQACCLDVDLLTFGEVGDLTTVGEKGVNLSGGQKARIALARALYVNADIYLLDDPLAAVDQQVARRIYDQCIGLNGLLKEKTRLLVTHQTHFLVESAHQIIFLKNGQIDPEGHLEQNKEIPTTTNDEQTKKEEEEVIQPLLLDLSKTATDNKSIIVNETAATGAVTFSVWYKLFSSTPIGWFGFLLLILIMLIGEAIFDVSNRWLSLWSAKDHEEQRSTIHMYVYLGLTLGTLIIALIRAQYYFYLILSGSNHLHNQMLTGMLYTSLRFFESNPSGRILNRISKDQQVIDELLPMTLFDALQCLLMTLGSLVVIGIVNPWVLLILIPFLPAFWWLRRFYLRSSRQIKRLESVTRSPVYALFSSSLNGGLPTIRAFNVQEDFVQIFINRVDTNSRAFFILIAAVRWFGLRLDLMTSILSLITSVLTIAFRHRIDPSSAALSLMYCINLTMLFQWAVRQSAEAENYMTSAERIYEYGQLVPEEDENNKELIIQPPDDWPSRGMIEFNKYSMRYRIELEPVLNNIDLRIEPKEKIGIIGRTGIIHFLLLKNFSLLS
jgi:ATP-binding cassette subfamily C (CFTR/MRP) protein 4